MASIKNLQKTWTGLVETYGIMVMRALRHRGDGGKLIVMRLNGLEEYMTDLITWQQKVDDLLHNGAI